MEYCYDCINFLYLNVGKRCPMSRPSRVLDQNNDGCRSFGPKRSKEFQGLFGEAKPKESCNCEGDCGDSCACNPGSGGCGTSKNRGCGGGCGGCGS